MDTRIRSITVGIPVTDIGEATKWYRELFGAREELDPTPKIKEFELLADFWLQLVEADPERTFHPVVRIGVEDLQREHERLANRGIQTKPIEVVPGLIQYFDFEDPYGNSLSFYELL